VTAVTLATLLFSLRPITQAQAAPAAIGVAVDKGWTKFSWSPSVRGPFTFSILPTSINPALLTLPARLTFTASARVKCPAAGNATVNVKVYDFDQLILSTAYPVSCPAASTYSAVKSGDNYLKDTHYFHGSVALASGGAHNLVVVTDLATTDSFFWAFARIDSAPGVPGKADIGTAAIALTAADAPAGAWVAVQWGDLTATQWTTIDNWTGPLTQTEGRLARWVDPKDYRTGPYRWVVYTADPGQGGQVWGLSDPFNFPRQQGDWVWSIVTGSPAAKALSSIK
jgi:hypothetical protein